MTKVLSVVGVFVLTASIAFAEGKVAEKGAPPAPPKPAAEFTTMAKYFVGNWKCDGTQAAGPWGPESKYTGKLGFKMELNDFWMSVDGEQKNATPPMTMTFKGTNGYDPATKKIVRADMDSMGGMMHMTAAPMWQGDNMVFTGEGHMMGQQMKVRHTITKKSATEFASVLEVAGADGKFSKMGDETCKKGAAASK